MLQSYITKAFIGFSYGISFPLTMVILDYWLKDLGVSNSAIGLFSFLHWPFMLKFFWGVFVENYDIPFVSRYLSRNKSWLVASYFALIVGILIMISPFQQSTNMFSIFFGASLIAIADGCRNIVLYPYQIMNGSANSFGFIASTVGLGHRLGSIFIKVAMLHFAHIHSWTFAYSFAAICVFILMISTALLDEPKISEKTKRTKSLYENFLESFYNPLKNLIKTKNGLQILYVVSSYKLADFMMQKMSRPFCVELGFSKYEIANIVQFYGSATVIIGSFLGGYIAKKIGIIRAMITIGILHACSFFTYLLLLKFGNSSDLLTIIITLEGLSGGAMTACFLAFFYSVSESSTIYAVLWAIHEFFGLIAMSFSGIIVDVTSWKFFFVLVPFITIISIRKLIFILDR